MTMAALLILAAWHTAELVEADLEVIWDRSILLNQYLLSHYNQNTITTSDYRHWWHGSSTVGITTNHSINSILCCYDCLYVGGIEFCCRNTL